MIWTEQSPWLIGGWIVTIIVAFLAGNNTHRLALTREAIARRREFREFVLVFCERLKTQSRGVRSGDYKDTITEIHRRAVILAAEDIAFWKRGKFLAAIERLESYRQEDIRPNPGPADTQEDRDKRCELMDAVRDRICQDIHALIRLAK
jgi:hypothetical protein